MPKELLRPQSCGSHRKVISNEPKGEGQSRRPESRRMSRSLDRWRIGGEDMSQTRERCVPHETPSGGTWGGQQHAVENNPGAGREEASGRELSWSRSGRQ